MFTIQFILNYVLTYFDRGNFSGRCHRSGCRFSMHTRFIRNSHRKEKALCLVFLSSIDQTSNAGVSGAELRIGFDSGCVSSGAGVSGDVPG